MVEDLATHSKAEALKEGWAQAIRRSSLLRRHLVGGSQRRALQGSAAAVPFTRDVLASAARVGGRRRLAGPLEAVPRGTRRGRHPVLGRDVQRRDVLARKNGGADVGKTRRGKGTKLMVVADGRGVPLGVRIAQASPAEVTLIESTLEQVAVPRSGPRLPPTKPRSLIYDKAADSDALRRRLKKRGIESICPHRSNRKRPVLQDGRSLRRYRRRWTIEKTVAWLENFRRRVVRYERKSKIFLAFLKVACLMITLRQFGNRF
jgi:transposase